jgi:hypothetical protein
VTTDTDFTVYTGSNRHKPNPSLDAVWAGTSKSLAGQISAGEVIPDPVPEPGTIAMMGSGLIAMAGFLRRRF